MSDMAPSAFNALAAAGLGPIDWVFCNWHVLHAVTTNLTKLHGGTKRPGEESADTLKRLKKHQFSVGADFQAAQLAENRVKCYAKINKIRALLSKEGEDSMLHYLETQWFKDSCVLRWALFARAERRFRTPSGTIIRTNMMLEAWHRVLKEVIFDGKVNKRLGVFFGRLLQERNRWRSRRFAKDTGLVVKRPSDWAITLDGVETRECADNTSINNNNNNNDHNNNTTTNNNDHDDNENDNRDDNPDENHNDNCDHGAGDPGEDLDVEHILDDHANDDAAPLPALVDGERLIL